MADTDAPDLLFKCTERFLTGIMDPSAVWGTTMEESTIMTIALAIDGRGFDLKPPTEDERIRQEYVRMLAKRVYADLKRHHMLVGE